MNRVCLFYLFCNVNRWRCKVSLCFAIYAWVGNFKFLGDYVMVTRCIVPALRRPCAHLTSYIRTLYTVVHSDRNCFFKSLLKNLVKYLLSFDFCFVPEFKKNQIVAVISTKLAVMSQNPLPWVFVKYLLRFDNLFLNF